MRVSEYMSHYPVSVSPHATVLEAAETMYGGGFRHLPVLEDGRLVGIISDRDLRQSAPTVLNNPPHHRISVLDKAARLGENGTFRASPPTGPVRPERIESGLAVLEVHSLMTREVETIEPSSTLRCAAIKFSQGGFGALLVLEDGELVGMFTMRDLLRWVLEQTRTR